MHLFITQQIYPRSALTLEEVLEKVEYILLLFESFWGGTEMMLSAWGAISARKRFFVGDTGTQYLAYAYGGGCTS